MQRSEQTDSIPPAKLKMGLIGGGGKGFIGRVHAIAATMDGEAELVAGALSSDPERSRMAASGFGIRAERAYGSWREMLDAESRKPAGERVDFISIATPNHTHYEIAREALAAGFHVVCDKPMTTNLHDAVDLAKRARASGRVFALSHNYSGYPMVRQARQMIAESRIGRVIGVRANYLQGWLWGWRPDVTPPRGAWKSDPAKTGPGGSLGDIGTHAYHLVRFVTQLETHDLACSLRSHREGWTLDDMGHVAIRFDGDALASIWFSQVSHGRLNDLSIEIDGTDGSLVWRQEHPNQLVLRRFGDPTQTLERNPNAPYMNNAGRAACRLPGGHPEAFYEAFANVYRSAFDAMRSCAAASDTSRGAPAADSERTLAGPLFPTVEDGVEGVQFVEQCIASHSAGGAWIPMPETGSAST